MYVVRIPASGNTLEGGLGGGVMSSKRFSGSSLADTEEEVGAGLGYLEPVDCDDCSSSSSFLMIAISFNKY